MNLRTLGLLLNLIAGLSLMGIGIYFVFFRPTFLPEDLVYLGAGQGTSGLLPQLSAWLAKVFTVLGGYIFSTGLLVFGIISTSHFRGLKTAQLFLLGAWATSIGLMTAINFSINSDFKWAIFAVALIWLAGIGLLYFTDKPQGIYLEGP